MDAHAVFGSGCVLLGLALAWRHREVARSLAAFVTEVTARQVSAHGRALARAGVRLLGMANMLLGAAMLFGIWHLIVPLATVLVAALVYLLVSLVRLSSVRA
ncbi:MAG: hypothetical protein U0232_15995 [Thermomicrobiales bacterium]